MTYARFMLFQRCASDPTIHVSYRSKTYTWNDVILVKRSMFLYTDHRTASADARVSFGSPTQFDRQTQKILTKPAGLVFFSEHGRSTLIWNVRTYLPSYTTIWNVRTYLPSYTTIWNVRTYLPSYTTIWNVHTHLSVPNGVIGFFHWHNPSGRTMALGSTQPLTEMSTRNISWG